MTALIANVLAIAATALGLVDEHTQTRRPPPMRTALASWYEEHGTGACGVGDVQSGYRFASLFLRCGTHVRFCHAGRCVTATMSDHGPYITGRTFDLNGPLKVALACPDLCWLQWRLWTPPPPRPPGARLVFW